jgi:hypothetical protein
MVQVSSFVCISPHQVSSYDFRPIYNGYMKVCFILDIDRLIVLNSSRSNRCITVRDDATFSSRISTHLLQIFIFSSVGGTWRLACICELLSLPISMPSSC